MSGTDPRRQAQAAQARRVFSEAVVRGIAAAGAALHEAGAQLLLLPAEHAVSVSRRDCVGLWQRRGVVWLSMLRDAVRSASTQGVPDHVTVSGSASLSLVDDDTIERQITASRLALAMMDKATWEFNDLRTRMLLLEGHEDLATNDLLRAQALARLVLDCWYASGLTRTEWQLFLSNLHEEMSHLLLEAYHETNDWLMQQGVLPEVDLRPYIRRTPGSRSAVPPVDASQDPAFAPTTLYARGMGAMPEGLPLPGGGAALRDAQAPPAGGAGAGMVKSAVRNSAEQVMAQLQRVLNRQVPGMASAGAGPQGGQGASPPQPLDPRGERAGPVTLTGRLHAAINHAQEMLRHRAQPQGGAAGMGSAGGTASVSPSMGASVREVPPPQQLEELKARNLAVKQVLKQAADTPAERATIEVVALLFQSILTEERIPATVRVWFARLQMPVLRVAISEPDFFATTDHPARRLIDRMGACVMGFNTSSGGDVSEAVEREIKRVVQVVEAYPDTGRRVFQTVLTEFEKFLAHYFEQENSASIKGVSLAQQVEQRETLAIQYTIELRKMLNQVPVQDGVRDFLFQTWADVLAVTAVRAGAQAEVTRQMKRAAADLIWSATAKVSREERAEVIRRLPPLLKVLREGMGHAGLSTMKQDEQIRALNNSLAAAFTAKTATIPPDRLEELMSQLETLEAMLPDTASGELDETLMRDLSSHESEDLEVVAEGGTPPSAAMLAWAKELQVGSWYMLDYRGRNEPVQLAWRGLRHHLILFVTSKGRGVLFQQSRLAAFLQAGLLLPAQDEALTVKATRNALAKLDADPERLLS
ncbi:DUF1631 family protein [Mitsuaria sp. WAJ17]|uniref:DUF1631 family protein n=1 Tax=Mitsuaria sp. WAJ17 TaxID=2761452 RepID=UPI0015FF763C|nr:DUF1631 family protein [Mitsuaria sp. WAJ17]MBB2485279.1 DUF1631 family protein [Mitsuaria sp. WAJ17]